MIGVVDYGAGNLRSVLNALRALGTSARVCAAASDVHGLDKLILPGVGHFASAAANLRQTGLMDAIADHLRRERPLLGICLGMQLLARSSDEGGTAIELDGRCEAISGLGAFASTVRRLRAERIPHMGWNSLSFVRESTAVGRIHEGPYYFAHSFAIDAGEGDEPWDESNAVLATADAGGDVFPAVVQAGSAIGVQFHPEKSGDRGMGFLERFCAC